MSHAGEVALLKVFRAAVDAYANRDWTTLASYYDDNVLLKLPNPVNPPIYGKSNVINFLAGEARDNPTFVAEPDPQNRSAKPHDLGDLVGFITHFGTWKDDHHGERPILYLFGFINKSINAEPDWKFTLLWSNN